MKKNIFALMALMAAICACNKEQDPIIEPQIPEVMPQELPVFTAMMEGAPETRATFDETYKCASWEEGDQISVNGIVFAAESAGTSTTFREAIESEEIRPAFISGSPVTNSNKEQSPDKLVDQAGTSTKWCDHVNVLGGIHIIVSAGSACKLQSIKLWNGGDTQSQSGRRWKNVNVYGSSSSDADGSWELLKSFTDLNLDINNNGVAGELVLNSTKEYQFYKIVVLSTVSGTLQQMSDMKFVVTHSISIPAPYEAYFPASLYTGDKTVLPSAISETWVNGKFNMPMYAKSESTNLNFKNLCGVLKITVKKNVMATVKRLRISSSNKAISGTLAKFRGIM